MKIFAIKDEFDSTDKILAYLLYYESEKKFYIELPDDADPWETPLLLSSLLKKGNKTINSYWSMMWIRERIIPSDRQNLGQILKENGLEEYDEYSLLMLANGRCAQDDYYLTPLSDQEVPKEFQQRYQKKVEDVIPLKDNNLLVFFRDGTLKKIDIKELLGNHRQFSSILSRPELFEQVAIQTGGYGVCWSEHLTVADEILYQTGITIPLSLSDFESFVSHRIINTAEVMEILECSRQNVNDLVKRRKLTPLKKNDKNILFSKSDVIQRKWN